MKPRGGFLALLAVTALFACVLPASAELRSIGSWNEIAPPGPSGDELEAQVAMARNGDVLVVWSALRDDNFSSEIYGRLFRRDGTPTTPAPLAINAETQGHQWQPRVATHGDGFAVVWTTTDALPCPVCGEPFSISFRPLSARLLDGDGGFRSPEIEIGGTEPGAGSPFLLTYPSGELLVLWNDAEHPFGRRGQRFGSAFQALTEPFSVDLSSVLDVVELADGGFAALSLDTELSVRSFGPTGAPIGEAQKVTSRSPRQTWGALGSFLGDGFAVAWSDDTERLWLRRFDFAGAPRGEEAPVSRAEDAPVVFPEALTFDRLGNAVVVWRSSGKVLVSVVDPRGELVHPPLEASPAQPFRERLHVATNRRDWAIAALERAATGGLDRRVVLDRLTAGCVPDATTLCLGLGRFALSAFWQTPEGKPGLGQVVRLTDDTGGFWFFSEDNLELVTKMLDGTGLNGWHWLFAAGLSSLRYELAVLDTDTGKTRTYVHPAGPLESRADTQAFSASDGAPPPATSTNGAGKAHPAMPCSATPESLCLQQARFRVQVRFVDPGTGETRLARAQGFSDAAGFFSFFDPDNVEVFVKILDGSPVNGRFWVFHAALSDVEYTIDVLDVFDGHLSWSYHNPRGRLHSAADTDAF